MAALGKHDDLLNRTHISETKTIKKETCRAIEEYGASVGIRIHFGYSNALVNRNTYSVRNNMNQEYQ